MSNNSGFTSYKLQLLDSALGAPLQSWDLTDLDKVSVGRSAENQVNIADPQVSRHHVELTRSDQGWTLESKGRNGTWVQGSRVERIELKHGTIFQLGSSGPMLQMIIQQKSVTDSACATLDNFAPLEFDFLNFNRDELADEVSKIAETEAFQRIQNETQRKNPSG